MKKGSWLIRLQHVALRLLAFALLLSLGAMSLSFRPNPAAQAEDWDALPRQQAEDWQWWMLQGAQQAEELPIEDIHTRVTDTAIPTRKTIEEAGDQPITASLNTRENRTHLPGLYFQTKSRIPAPGYYHFLHLYTPF